MPLLQTPGIRAGGTFLCAMALTIALITGKAGASAVIVPDESPSIQAAIDTYAPDTVLVRAGYYPEEVRITNQLIMRALPSPPESLVRVQRLYIDYTHRPLSRGPISLYGVHCLGQLLVRNDWTELYLTLGGCIVDSGFVDESLGQHTGELWVLRSRVSGGARLDAGIVHVSSSSIYGPTSVRVDGIAWLSASNFEGDGSGTGITLDAIASGAAHLDGCYIRGFESALVCRLDDTLTLEGCTFSDCVGDVVTGGPLLHFAAIHNRILGGYGGMRIRCDRAELQGNRIIGCRASGVDLYASESAVLRRNVIGRCGEQGIYLPHCDDVLVENNTVFLNSRAGMAIVQPGRSVVRHNVGYGNGWVGLYTHPDSPSQLECNDWFGNAEGAVIGSNTEADVELDPKFCNVALDDVTLRTDSPLLNVAGCDSLGAEGVGCDVPTPTLILMFTATRLADGVALRWQLANEGTRTVIWVERSGTEAGPWTRVETIRTYEGECTVEIDRTTVVDQSYWYRLIVSETAVDRVIRGPIQVGAASIRRFGFIAVQPNPSYGPVAMKFDVAYEAPISLEVFDVQGRCVATLARGVWPAGEHRVEWKGEAGGETCAPGMYLVRYNYPGGQEIRRIVRAE